MSRCKHLCCRDGVDKAPKPPKNIPPSEGLGAEVKKPTPKLKEESTPRLQTKKPANSEKSGNIKMVDLSKDRDLDEYARNGPRDYRKLHRLHDSVNKGSAVPLIPSKKATFSYKDGDNPIVSSFASANKNIETNNEISSDYDGGWIDEFPSPSEIFGMEKKNMRTFSSTGQTRKLDPEDFDDFSDLELELSEPKKLAHPDDYEGNDSANAPVRVLEDVKNRKDADKGPKCIKLSSVEKLNFEQPSCSTSDDRLFLSTSSPEKPLSLPEKRKSTYAAEAGNRLNEEVPVAKRRRVSMQPSGQDPDPSSIGETQALSVVQQPGPMIQKSGRPRPAWVNEFDPEFIAEYADFVEFV